MFSSVQSWIFDGSWCCLWTDADRKVRSRRGPLKSSSTWLLFHRCGAKTGSSGWGRTAVAAWVASVRDGLERRTRDCLNMESKGDRARDSVPVKFSSGEGPIKTQVGSRISYRKTCMYAKTNTSVLKNACRSPEAPMYGQSTSLRQTP